ncbi:MULTISPECIES: ATP-dependent helicase [Acidiplasma]|uniref:ATP-dependent helicase n=2 Tax=Acidiplasma TaxID=507753 RepID=A0A0P9EQG5_9ARCH|nr:MULTISPECIES: ATP-dependent helicase [Acidiplasma]KJE49905.1 ATP-dependent helicase [Acidiplasma sp. MBA-1]KPV45838.1 ATP-dependent helicase [Acidiplasma aeolicum]WMT55087.1 MAG: ATP-dependent helicase [Acidiplasma sp.]
MINEKPFKVKQQLPFLDDIIAEWFDSKYDDLSEPQKKAIPLIHNGKNVLVSSPTGTGKTLTGFLSILNELFINARNNSLEDKIYCVYISPLKALANDIDKNLKEPLKEIYDLARSKGENIPDIRIGVRSGDTGQSERGKMLRKPPHILITTPESLSLALTATKFREKFADVQYVIVDEIHEISATKRGSLLSLNLERLYNIAGEYTRIGLSATQAPLDLIASYLCGYAGNKKRECEIIEVNTNKYLDLKIITPVKDLTMVSFEVANEKMYDIMVDLINSHKTTLIFTNTRSSTEHVAIRLKARGIENIEAHHSSLGKETRIDVENKLKNGELKCVITSTSLELGIDIGFIDLVIQIGSPKSVSRALQRIGRSGHGVRDLSKGRFIVFDLDDLMECAVMTKAAYDHEIDKVSIPLNPLDVLSQGIIGMALEKVWNIDDAYNLIKNSFSFHTLDYNDYIATLNYLAGKIEGNTLFSKIWLDEEQKTFGKKKSTRMIYFMNVGTIPEEANYNVVNEQGRIIGQLSDKFVERLKKGDIFVLGAKTYIFLRTSRNNITVREAKGMKPTVPSWTGELLPRSYDLGVLIGKFRETLYKKIKAGEDPRQWLIDNYRVDEYGAMSLISYVKSQGSFYIPTHDRLFIEGYIDKDLYDIIFHIPLGRRINDAISRAYALAISNKYGISTRLSVNDNGFMITIGRRLRIDDIIHLINAGNFEDLLDRSIVNTEMFKQRFRYCATRSLMVLRKYKQTDISVARQQLRSDRLLRVLESMNNFPVIKETFNEIKNDLMDVNNAKKYINDVIDSGHYKIRDYSDESSPFSYNLILSGVSDIVLMEDRSKLLRELQNKLLDKIYGTNGIDFLIKDSKMAEDYFKNKIPRVIDENSYMDFIKHFLYIDPFKKRYNSPLDYTDMDIEKITYELIDRDILVYAFMRSDQWVYRGYYDIMYSLFKKEVELNNTDKEVLNNVNLKSYSELKKLGINEDALKDSLMKLEENYLIRKKLSGHNSVYIKNDIKVKTSGNELKDAVKLILSSFGPLSMDELQIRLPVDSDMLEQSMEELIKTGEVIYDYITPIFVKQYILKNDLDAILNKTDENILTKRIINFIQEVDDVSEYFEKYGFAFDVYDILIRTKHYNQMDLNKMLKNQDVYYLKAIKNKYVYISKWLVDALYYLRYEKNTENEENILRYIAEGYNTEEELLNISGLDKSIIKVILKSLTFKFQIMDNNGIFTIYYPVDNNSNIIIEKYGPATAYELSRFFWFNPARIDYSGLKPYYYKNDVYYGFIKNSNVQNRGIIVNINDPVSIYLGKYIQNDDYNARFIYNGAEEAIFHMEMRTPGIWIDNLYFEHPKVDEFIEALLNTCNKTNINSIIIKVGDGISFDNFEKYGFKKQNDVIYRGNFEIMDITNDDLIELAVKKSMNQNIPINYSVLNKMLFGFRNDIESSYFGVRSLELNNYYNSVLLYNFNGPFGINALATKNVISIYRSAKKNDLNSQEEKILKMLISESMSENELIKTANINSIVIKNSIKNLYKINAIARDKNRKYIVINSEYNEQEAIENILSYIIETIGFFDDAIYERFMETKISRAYLSAVKSLISARVIHEVLIPSEKKIIYVSTAIDMAKIKKMNVIRLITPKDIISLFFTDYIKSRYKTVNSYLLFYNNSIKANFTVKKSGKYLSIKSFNGDNSLKGIIKKEFNNAGYILSI